jgi:hypothetical protein
VARALAVVLLGTLLAAAARPAWSLTPAEIERGAARAGKGVGAIVRRLASPAFAGRDNATPGSAKAQRLIVGRLRRLGEGPGTGSGSEAYRQRFVVPGQTGVNLLAVIRGRELPDEYVVVGGHYDHLGTRSDADGSCARSLPPGGEICNGATDNGAGTAVVLGIGRAIRKLRTPPRRSVVLALWDAEEDGLAGSRAYVDAPLVPLAATRAYVNFDIAGSDLLPSLSRATFAIGAETGGSALQAFVEAADGAERGLEVRSLSYIFGQERSDYANFVRVGVPTVFFGDGTNGCYHTVDDDPGIVDGRKLAAQARLGYRVAMALAEDTSVPPFRGARPSLAAFPDAVALDTVFRLGLDDLDLFPPEDQAVVQQTHDNLAAIVAGGPESFDQGDIITLFIAAGNGIDAITRLGCLGR